MMKYLFWLIILLPFFTRGQESQGIRWERGKTWKEILEIAKQEGKYVFVDCYATWCVPCKKMEQEVFKSQEVGDVVNKKFLSVRLQIDSTSKDDKEIKTWYGDAHNLNIKYK